MSDGLMVQDLSVELAGRRVLDQLSFEARPGEFVGIIGPNGAGKSTLLKALLGLIPAAEGRITLTADGEPVPRLARAVGYVPQARPLDAEVPISAWDFVSLNLPQRAIPWIRRKERQAIAEALRLTQAEHLAHAAIGGLSGGEKQKIFLAQALVRRPLMLLLDEPTANLDPGAQERMTQMVASLCREQGIGVLFISHDINQMAEYADRILFLAKGQYAYGSVSEMMRPEVLSPLYGYEVNVRHSGDRYAVIAESEQAAPVCFHEEAHR